MSTRPAIPVAIRRKVLVESGHRCAVDGTPCPLETAHIVPWHISQEHKAADLICLCANCHERADREKWGEQQLREYKVRPSVSRQFERSDDQLQMTRVELTIDMDLSEFDELHERLLQHALALLLNISPNAVRIIAKDRTN